MAKIQKYAIDTKFESAGDGIEYRVIEYEESLSDDKDDHYEVCFDEEFNLTLWTKQSNLDKLTLVVNEKV